VAATGAATSWGEFLRIIQGPLENLMTEHADLQKEFEFEEADAEGDSLTYPMLVRAPHGVTHAHTGTAKRTDYNLNPPVSSRVQKLQIDGKEFTLTEDIATGLIHAAKGGKTSDGRIVDQTLAAMRRSSQYYLELETINGGRPAVGIGVVESVTDGGSGTHSVVITKASWAAGIWDELEGAPVDVYDDDGDPLRTTALSCTVQSVAPDTRTVVLAGTEAELDTIVAGDVIMPAGWYGATAVAGTTNTFKGLMGIASHTSGDFMGIDASTYGKLVGNVTSIGSAKFSILKALITRIRASSRGAKGDMTLLCSDWTFIDVMNEASALRRYVESTKAKMEIGTKGIEFIVGGGVMTLRPHPMVMAGEVCGFVPKNVKYVGTHKPRMEWPSGEEKHLEDKKAVRFREGYGLGLLSRRGPANHFYASGIVNESLT
jgi:hypothetical protein